MNIWNMISNNLQTSAWFVETQNSNIVLLDLNTETSNKQMSPN